MLAEGGSPSVGREVEKVVDEELIKKNKEKHEAEIRALEEALIEMQSDFFK